MSYSERYLRATETRDETKARHAWTGTAADTRCAELPTLHIHTSRIPWAAMLSLFALAGSIGALVAGVV